jgi:hypothetical protein
MKVTVISNKYTLIIMVKGESISIDMSILDNLHIYVIGDKKREPTQIAYIEDYLSTSGLTNVTYFQPTWKDCLTEHQIQHFVETMDLHGRPLKRSEMSLFLNFLYTFQQISAAHSSGWFLLLESDVIFEGDLADYLQRLSAKIETLEADCISLGSGCDLIDDNVNIDDMSFQLARKYVVRCTDTLLFSWKGLNTLNEYMQSWIQRGEQFNEPIDNFFDTFIKNTPEYRYYWVWPSITLQGSQNGHYPSSIQDPLL